LGVLLLDLPRYALAAVKMRYKDVDAMTPVEKLYDVGTATAAVFREANMRYVGDIKYREHHHQDLQIAIDTMKQTIDKPAAVWRRLAARLDDVVLRIQHEGADGCVPAAFMCPISMSWYEVRHEFVLGMSASHV